MENERISLPVVALRGMTILPEMVAHFDVSREKSLQAIDQAMTEGEKIFLTGQYEIETEDPDVTDIHRIGCIATIKQIVKLPKKISRVLVSGEQRAELIDLEFKEPYLRGMVAVREDVDTSWEDTGAVTTQSGSNGAGTPGYFQRIHGKESKDCEGIFRSDRSDYRS